MWLVPSPKVSSAHFALANQIHLFDCLSKRGANRWNLISEGAILRNPGGKLKSESIIAVQNLQHENSHVLPWGEKN